MSTPIEKADQFLQENELDRIDFHETSYAWGFREKLHNLVDRINKHKKELKKKQAAASSG